MIIVKEAIGDRFHAVLVDNGVMRLNECQQVKETLTQHLGINLTIADASKLFLDRLKGVEEPEKKRKIIGGTFIDIFEEEAVKIEKAAEATPSAGKVEWFLQGTLYPDVIESLSFKGPSDTIKTHHNVGGLPKRMMEGQGLKLIEVTSIFPELYADNAETKNNLALEGTLQGVSCNEAEISVRSASTDFKLARSELSAVSLGLTRSSLCDT
jgi:GMP synthase (glutamine-hydrolysing) B subunit